MPEQKIGRVLVANRGEIALRVMRSCREMGIETVAVYGDGEENAPHVRYATDAYRVPDGPGLPYLRIDGLIEVAKRSGAVAIHPGYGFLAENAGFSRAVTDAGLIFIGPTAEAMSRMGDKIAARQVAKDAGVPMVPGTDGEVGTIADALAWAGEHGYPVAVKASGGGGGKGFRVARGEHDMAAAFDGARGEAERYFSNPSVFLERYLERPRHIEVQVFVDASGKVWAFPERECSIQRRHQKLVEETPSPVVTEKLRARLQASSIALVEGIDYRGAGTVEYLLDSDGTFYFLEMNTRIQVEHTVTEMVTGVDLVREQLLAAMGAAPTISEADLIPRGWSIQCRINAEDPGRDFAPSAGTLSRYEPPVGFGVRVESAIGQGDPIMVNYDSMIAKLVTWARTRDEAIDRMLRSLGDYAIEGVATTIPFHRNVLSNEAFRAGDTTVAFLAEHPGVLDIVPATVEPGSAAEDGAPEPVRMLVEVGGRRLDVSVSGISGLAMGTASPVSNGARRRPRGSRAAERKASGNDILSPGHGTVLRVDVEDGQHVSAGDTICVVEAMKMENEVVAHREGVVHNLSVQPGSAVSAGVLIATISDAH